MNHIIKLLIFVAILPVAHAAPAIVEAKGNKFLHVRDVGEDVGDYFVRLKHIVSIDIEKSTNGEDADFELDVQKFWTDVAVTPSMFVLNPPE